MSDETKEKLDSFLSRNDVSFTLPDRNHQVYVGNDVNGDRQYWTKNSYCGFTKNLLVFYKQKMMRSYHPFSTLYRYVSPKKEYVGRSKIP